MLATRRHNQYVALPYLNAKYLHTIGSNHVIWRSEIRTIHQMLSQPVNSCLNIASKAISR